MLAKVKKFRIMMGWVAASIGILFLVVWFGNSVLIALETCDPSRSIGTPARGRLQNGRRLPTSGVNFKAYSRVGALLGRNSVHQIVHAVITDAYVALAKSNPSLIFVYGETGWPHGGPFPPHRTHQNGLSVDFMVPVRDLSGRSITLPTVPWRRFGYDLEFDSKGHLGKLQIDFEAIAEHLAALDKAAGEHGTRIKLLIFAPEYQSLLWHTDMGRRLQGRFPVMKTPAWVRHDEHYHVDFENPAG
jgi:penicillin-insensitive murein DD-endopeptidase